MKTIELTEANSPLSRYARQASGGSLIVTKKGKPVAALVSVEGIDWETLALSSNPVFMSIIGRARKSVGGEGTVSSAEARRQLGLPPAAKPRRRPAKR